MHTREKSKRSRYCATRLLAAVRQVLPWKVVGVQLWETLRSAVRSRISNASSDIEPRIRVAVAIPGQHDMSGVLE